MSGAPAVHLTNIRALVVEHAERVDLGPSTRVLVEWECKEKLLQQFAILRPAGVVTERGDFEAEAVEPQRPESGVGDRDDLSVERGVVDPDGFDADLLQLAVATGLRALVAEERARVADLDRQLSTIEAVLDDRTHDSGGSLGTQRHRTVTAVGECVHLFADDVGRLTDTASEQAGVLEDRQFDVAVSGQPRGARQTVTNGDEFG